MRACLAAVAAFAFAVIPVGAAAAPGDLRPAFGSGGKVLTNFGVRDTQANAMALSGSFIVTAGFAHNGTDNDFAVMRFNSDGTVDQSFGGGGGRVTIDFGTDDRAQAVAIQPDGRIVVGGRRTADSTFLLARLTTDGELDLSFGDFGGVSTYIAGNDGVFALAIQADGKIVAAGTSNSNNFAVVRYNADGTLDTSFGCATPGTCTGKVVTDLGAANDEIAYALAVQADGKIVAAGVSGLGATSDFAIVRYQANGLLDTSFGCSTPGSCTGMVKTSVAGDEDQARALILQPDGKLVAGGFSKVASQYDFSLVRYLANGTLDPSFGIGGKVTTDLGGNDRIFGLALQSDGRIVAGGVSYAGAPDFGLARYDTNGVLDANFGCASAGSCSGIVVMPMGSFEDEANAVAVQSDGKVLAAGRSATSNSFVSELSLLRLQSNGTADSAFGVGGKIFAVMGASSDIGFAIAYGNSRLVAAGTTITTTGQDFAVSRYLENGALDTAFGTQGRSTVDFGGGVDFAAAVAIQPADSKVVAAGGGYNISGFDFAVARLLANGQPDTSFGIGGRVLTGFASGDDVAYAVTLQADGRIVAAGYATNGGATTDFALARYNVNGSLDAAFGTGGKVFTPLGAASGIQALAVQSDGKIVAAGAVGASGPTQQVAIARYNANGTLDTNFACATPGTCTGTATISIGEGFASINALKILADGRIVAAGAAKFSSYMSSIAMRFHANGTLDATFGTSGIAAFSVASKDDNAYALAVDDAGRLILAGTAYIAGARAYVARLRASGALDTTFGAGGVVTVSSGIGDTQAAGVAILPSQAIVIVGDGIDFDYSGSRDFLLAALEGGGLASQSDFNADAHPDIIWSNTSSGSTYLWYMTGPPPMFVSDAFIAGIDPSWKIQGVADFNGDGKPDLVWRNTASGNTYVWYMNGPAFVSDAFLFSLPAEWVIQGVADFNADGRPDFLMRNTSTGVGFVWFFNNATAIGDQFLFGIDPMWKVEQVGDMNADNQPDLLFRNMSSGLAFAWYTQYSGGTLSLAGSSPPIFSIDPIWEIAQLEDWNGDANRDLLFRNTGSGVVFVWYMTGVTLGGSDYVIQIDPPWEIVPRR